MALAPPSTLLDEPLEIPDVPPYLPASVAPRVSRGRRFDVFSWSVDRRSRTGFVSTNRYRWSQLLSAFSLSRSPAFK